MSEKISLDSSVCNCRKRKGDQAIPESGKLPAGNQPDFTGTGIYLLPTRQIVYKPLFFTSGQIP